MNVVVDTNIFVSALIKEGMTRDLIINSQHNLLFPEFEFIEIKRHKEEILKKSGLSEGEFEILLSKLLEYITIIKTIDVLDYKKQADEIMEKIDKDDVIFIATALAFNCQIWSDDVHFQKQKIVKVLTTKDMIG